MVAAQLVVVVLTDPKIIFPKLLVQYTLLTRDSNKEVRPTIGNDAIA